jgi:hypothetical protein
MLRLQGDDALTVAQTVIRELLAKNAALRLEREMLAAEKIRLQDLKRRLLDQRKILRRQTATDRVRARGAAKPRPNSA